jgi:hypothetical protein
LWGRGEGAQPPIPNPQSPIFRNISINKFLKTCIKYLLITLLLNSYITIFIT